MEIIEIIGIPHFKKGNRIHIKKKNRGKFTDYCGGEVTQACINRAKKSKNSTLRKRATFADNARKWKHLQGGSVKRLDIESLKADPEYKNNYNWYIHDSNINALQDSLINRNAGYALRIAALSMVIPESGGKPDPHGNGAVGLIGWRGDRAKGLPKDFGGQAHELMNGLFSNDEALHWSHGGAGTGVNTGKEMYLLYNTSQNVNQATSAIMKGYVRPEKSEYQKRLEFAQLLKKHMK